MRKSPLAYSFLTLLIKYPKLLLIALLLGGLSYTYELFVARDTMVFQGIPKATRDGLQTFIRIFRNDAFMVGYSDIRGNPLWVVYKLSAPKASQPLKRPENFTSDWRNFGVIGTSDYTNSGYDRGHMAPNRAIAQLYGKKAQEETFLMTNITPQKPSLNQKLWQRLESLEFEVFTQKFKSVWVYTGPLFNTNVKRLKSSYWVEIPDAFYKIYVGIQADGSLKTLAFVIPQNAKANTPLEKFIVSIDTVEKSSGFDFLHTLEDGIENELEKQTQKEGWF